MTQQFLFPKVLFLNAALANGGEKARKEGEYAVKNTVCFNIRGTRDESILTQNINQHFSATRSSSRKGTLCQEVAREVTCR